MSPVPFTQSKFKKTLGGSQTISPANPRKMKKAKYSTTINLKAKFQLHKAIPKDLNFQKKCSSCSTFR
jgi:hypothetical protein